MEVVDAVEDGVDLPLREDWLGGGRHGNQGLAVVLCRWEGVRQERVCGGKEGGV